MSISFLEAGNGIKNNFNIITSFFSSKKALVEENKFLKNEVVQLRSQNYGRDLILLDNIRLKSLLNKNDEKDLVLAYVLSKPNISPYDSLIIDIGKNLDINRGDKIFIDGDFLIGEIVDVWKRSSKVKLYSSAGEENKVNIILLDNAKISALAYGKGGGNFEIKVPRGVGIKKGDIITHSDISNAVLGIVGDVFIDPMDSFQTILCKSPFNIFELDVIQVLRSHL